MKANLHIVDTRTASAYTYYQKPYPNAVEPRYFTDKLIDGMLALATVMGSVTIFLFLLAL